MTRIEAVEKGSGEGQQRERTNAAGPLLIRAGVEFLERQAKKEAEGDQHQERQDGGRGGHFRRLYRGVTVAHRNKAGGWRPRIASQYRVDRVCVGKGDVAHRVTFILASGDTR